MNQSMTTDAMFSETISHIKANIVVKEIDRNRNITKARLHLYDPSIDVSSLFFSCPGSFLASNMRQAFLYHVTDPWRNLKECYIVSINKAVYSAKQRSFSCFYFQTEH